MNIKNRFKDITAYFSPEIIGEVNNVYVKLAMINGDKVPWHNHANEDEAFYIIEGSLLFELEGKDPFVMNEGDFFIVTKGINHRVSSTNECKIMLIENKTTAHTGTVKSAITKSIKEQLK